ncbi:MAG: Gfo/Idh/MocA family oxidoreductase [Bacilli bacterium]
MKKIRVIIIGMGKMGKIRLNAFLQHGGFEIVGLCDSNPQMLSNYNNYPLFSEWKECIDKAKPDAVFVCAINYLIADIVCYSLEKHCHVFSEKPPGRNLEDTLRMKDSFEKNSDYVLKFGFNHRYHNSIIEAKALLDSNTLGKPVCIRGIYGKAGNLNFANEWRNNPLYSGGGILLDQGIHMLDLIRYFLGDIAEVFCSVDNLVWKNIPTEDSVYAIFKTSGGQIASLHSSCIQWKHKFDMDIICENGYIALNGILTSTQSYGEEHITFYKKDLEFTSGKMGNPIETTMCFDKDSSWDIEIAEFYDAVAKGKPLQNGTIYDAVEVMKLIDKIYKQKGENL